MKQGKQLHFLLPSALSLSVAVLAAGCGGGSSDGAASLPLVDLTPERVTTNIDDAVATVANCERTAGSTVISSVGGRQIQDILSVSRSMATSAEAAGTPQTLVVRPSSDAGKCSGRPGTVSVSSHHEDGDTTYTLDFNAYCADGPEGETVLTGVVNAVEDGTGTPAGPEVSALKLSSDQLQMDFKDADGSDQSANVSIKGARTAYGKPAIRGADVPTSDSPDHTTVSNITIELTTKAETHQFSGLDISRYGDDTATITISGGRYITPDDEAVNLSTPNNNPLIVNVNTGDVTGGAVMLEGRNQSSVLIETTDDSRVMAVVVNGNSLGDEVDCSNTAAPVTEVLGAILSRLPLGYN